MPLHYLTCPVCRMNIYPCPCSANVSHPMNEPCVNCREEKNRESRLQLQAPRLAEELYLFFQSRIEELDSQSIVAMCGTFVDANAYTQRLFVDAVFLILKRAAEEKI